MLRLFGGQVEDWNKEFDTPLAKKRSKKGSGAKGVYNPSHQMWAATMVPLWRRGQKLVAEGRSINYDFYADLGDEF